MNAVLENAVDGGYVYAVISKLTPELAHLADQLRWASIQQTTGTPARRYVSLSMARRDAWVPLWTTGTSRRATKPLMHSYTGAPMHFLSGVD